MKMNRAATNEEGPESIEWLWPFVLLSARESSRFLYETPPEYFDCQRIRWLHSRILRFNDSRRAIQYFNRHTGQKPVGNHRLEDLINFIRLRCQVFVQHQKPKCATLGRILFGSNY